jgi:hypothetical protein
MSLIIRPAPRARTELRVSAVRRIGEIVRMHSNPKMCKHPIPIPPTFVPHDAPPPKALPRRYADPPVRRHALMGEHRIQLRHHGLDLLFKFFDEVWNAAHPDLSFHELSQRYRRDSNHRTSVRNIAGNT